MSACCKCTIDAELTRTIAIDLCAPMITNLRQVLRPRIRCQMRTAYVCSSASKIIRLEFFGSLLVYFQVCPTDLPKPSRWRGAVTAAILSFSACHSRASFVQVMGFFSRGSHHTLCSKRAVPRRLLFVVKLRKLCAWLSSLLLSSMITHWVFTGAKCDFSQPAGVDHHANPM